MKLSNGTKGNQYKVNQIKADFKIKKRLQDMGLTQGVVIKLMSKYSNNAFIFDIRGSRVVLGMEIVDEIEVSQVTEEE